PPSSSTLFPYTTLFRSVNIVAHSMGGLDARYAISQLGLGGRVASLITIGTPHLGTPLADAGHALFGRITRLLRRIVDLTAFGDRSEEHTSELQSRFDLV